MTGQFFASPSLCPVFNRLNAAEFGHYSASYATVLQLKLDNFEIRPSVAILVPRQFCGVTSNAVQRGTMPIEVNADLLWVIPQTDADQMVEIITDFLENNDSHDARIGSHDYRLTHMSWLAQSRAFCGTIYRKRTSNLPSELTEDEVRPLDIPADAQLGEPMCFAYYPDHSAAVVQYSHTGARYGKLASFLNEMGFPAPIDMSPVLNADAMLRLQNAQIIRKLQYSLHVPQHAAELRAVGGAVGEAVNMVEELRGVNIEVTVTMGHDPGSLSLNSAKRVCRRLSELGDAVGKLKVLAAEGEEDKPVPIDFVNDRLHRKISVGEIGREMDKNDCCRQLRAVFDAHRALIEAQRGQVGGA